MPVSSTTVVSDGTEHENLDAMLKEIEQDDFQACSNITDGLFALDEMSENLQNFGKDLREEELVANNPLGDCLPNESVERFFLSETSNAESVSCASVIACKEKTTTNVGIVDRDTRNLSGIKRKQGTHGNQVVTPEFSSIPN
jgi:hypothetical protein